MANTPARIKPDDPLNPARLGQPFKRWQAEDEMDLNKYFFFGPHYSDIFQDPQNPHTDFIFGSRGAGKSVYRWKLEQDYRPQSRTSKVLNASYIDFSSIRAELGENLRNATIESHWRLLLKCMLRALLRDWISDPQPYFNLSSKRRLPLVSLFHQYSPEAVDKIALVDLLSQWGERKLADTIESLNQSSLSTNDEFLKLVQSLQSITPEPLGSLPMDHLQKLLDILNRLEIEKVCVMVDNIDQLFPPETHIEDAITFLLPFCQQLDKFQSLPLAFKYFLPIELAPGLKEHGVAFDHFPRHDLDWTDKMLREMLRNRLGSVSNGEIFSLGELAEEKEIKEPLKGAENRSVQKMPNRSKTNPSTVIEDGQDAFGGKLPLPKRIDDEIIANAFGSPRQVIMLVNLLFASLERRQATETLFNEEDLEWTLSEYKKRYGSLVPPLRIDTKNRQARIGVKDLNLSATEFDCLVILLNAHGEILTKKQLWEKLRPQDKGHTPEQVDTFWSRLRKKVERDSSNPVYLQSERSKGYWLENAQ